jgi:hypothetical protein
MLNGRQVLVYGTVVTSALPAAIKEEEEIRTQYRLPKDLEIKWALQHHDPGLKATVKQELLGSLSKHFRWLVTIHGGADKDQAFLKSLEQIRCYAESSGSTHINIYYDEGTFRTRGPVDVAIAGWRGVRCTNFARATSKYSIGLEYADMLAGAFGYMVQAHFTGRSTVARPPADGHGYFEDWNVDAIIGVMLRWSSWGTQPQWGPDGPTSDDDMVRDCLGRGVILEGDFTDEERERLKHCTRFWLGCTR